MYGNLTRRTKQSDCLPCPVDTFNNLKGMQSCRPCGSSARAILGQAKCKCLGLHRSFQVSDGSCECESGYLFYDEVDVKQTEGNSDKPCQPIVSDYVPIVFVVYGYVLHGDSAISGYIGM